MTLKLALVGCGAISKKHLAAIYENGHTYELIAVCDVDIAMAEETANSYVMETAKAKPSVFDSVDAVFSNTAPDVVAIATPSAHHADAVVQALDAGAHVIVEKPLALSSGELDRIEEAAARSPGKATVCYVTRFAPHIRVLSRAIEEGRLGQILHAGLSIYWNRNDEYYRQAPWRGTWELDGGALMNQCTHGIDLLQWVCGGKPSTVQSELRRFARPIEAEDFGSALISFENGSVATFTGTVVTYPKNLGASMTIIGESGTIQLGGNGLNLVTAWRFADAGENEERDMVGGEYGSVPGKTGHAGVYEDFASAIQDDREPRVTLEDARTSVDLVLGMYQSTKENRHVSFPVDFATAHMSSADIE